MTSRVILLVEDNPDDVDLTLRAFAQTGEHEGRFVVARDGVEALEVLFGNGQAGNGGEGLGRQTLAVVLLDLKIPKIDGLEVLRRIRADVRTRRLPVVMLTSSDDERDRASSYDLGVNSFIRKPVDFARFVDAARVIRQYWLGLNESPPMEGRP
jgi:two-component system, response regulator